MSNLRSNQADQALLKYESGQEYVAAQAMTDDGDNQTFSITDYPWSGRAGYEAVIRPNGVITGGEVTPGTADDTVDVAGLTCYLAGVETEVSASSGESLTRATDPDTHVINSITITSDGDIAVLQGTEHTSFSTTRNADGGPPYIPTDSIEIAQVKLSSNSAGAVTSDEIYQVPGTSNERYDHPIWSEYPAIGEIEFTTALPESHSDNDTDTFTKEVYAEVYTPIFASLEPTSDFVPPENSHSVSSTQVYGGTIGTTSSSLNQGSFTAYLKDAITDPIIALKDETLWFKFYPHRLKDPYHLCQGKFGVSRTFPAGDAIQAACTISANAEGEDNAS